MMIATLPRPDIRCVLFDLGSTLWRRAAWATWFSLETAANLRAIAALRALLPAEALPAVADETLGASLCAMIDRYIKYSHRFTPDEEPQFAELTLRALRALGITRADLPLGALVYEALRVRAATSRVLDPDTLQTLAALRAREYLLGIVTNRHYGGTPFLADLEQMGLLDFVQPEHVAISADLGYRKPHPAMYWHVLNRMHVPPAQAAMVGDNIVADVYGAQQLGLFTVWKPQPEHRAAAHAERLKRLAHDPGPPGETEPGTNTADDNDHLFAWARQRVRAQHPCVSTMLPPDAVITQVSDVLRIFRDRTRPPA